MPGREENGGQMDDGVGKAAELQIHPSKYSERQKSVTLGCYLDKDNSAKYSATQITGCCLYCCIVYYSDYYNVQQDHTYMAYSCCNVLFN